MTTASVATPDDVERRVQLALAMIDMGAAVFPLSPGAKTPLIPKRKGGGGFLDAHGDRELAATFLRQGGRPNYGVVFPEGSDIVVLDLDGGDRDKRPGWQTDWQRLYEQLGPPGLTFIVRTPSGGRHAYYRWRSDLYGPMPPGDEMLGWTVRKPWKGYLVGPGSTVGGATYEPVGAAAIADLPETWARAAIAEKGQARAAGDVVTFSSRDPVDIATGHRHAYLRDRARHLVGVGLAGDALFAAVMDLNRQLADPKSEDEVRRAIGDAESKFERDPIDPATGRAARPPAEAPAVSGPLVDAPLTEFESRPVEWVWPAWLPRGVVTVMDGNPGVSKSTLVADLFARITTGRDWPDGSAGTGIPGRCIWITTEDDPGRVLRPRIEAAGGDARLVRFVTSEVVFPDAAASFADLLVRRAREPEGLVVVVLDPLFSHVGPTVKTISDSNMRTQVMRPLSDAAEAADVAVLVIRHFSKDTKASAINRGAGSLGGIVGAARSVWTAVVDPDDDEGAKKIVGVAKSSYARVAAAWRYCVEDRTPPGWLTGTVPVVRWIGTADQAIEAILDAGDDAEDAARALDDILGKGPLSSKAVFAAMQARGFGRHATRGAKRRLRVEAVKSGFGGGWHWRLPSEGSEESGQAIGPDSSVDSGRGSTTPDSSGRAKNQAPDSLAPSGSSRAIARAGRDSSPDSSDSSGTGRRRGVAEESEESGSGGVRTRGRAPAREDEPAPVLVDTDGSASWAGPCHFYADHRSAHFRAPDGWRCRICSPLEEGA